MVNLSEVGCGGLYCVAARGKNARIGGDEEDLWRVSSGAVCHRFSTKYFYLISV